MDEGVDVDAVGLTITTTEDEDSSSESSSSSDSSSSSVHSETEIQGQHRHPCDNLGFVPILIPVCGITTMLGTVIWSCSSRFDCNEHYPTLSYAATFKPEGHVFTFGMCLTALLILSTTMLFCWHLRLRLTRALRFHQFIFASVFVFGMVSSIALFTLAVCDMRNYHDTHVIATVVFFIGAWCTILAAHLGRVQVAQQRHAYRTIEQALEQGTSPQTQCTPRLVVWFMQRARCVYDVGRSNSFRYGRAFIYVGIASSCVCKCPALPWTTSSSRFIIVGILFCCVNGIWSNPVGFTAAQEALAELIAIICQLLFMGTLWSEIARLHHDVERDYQLKLARAE